MDLCYCGSTRISTQLVHKAAQAAQDAAQAAIDFGVAAYNAAPASHAVDPDTSAMAERRITFSGKRGTQMRVIYEAVKNRPGLTSAEYAVNLFADEIGQTNIDRVAVARRLPDLQKLGYVYQGEKRKCTDCGSLCVTWWLEERKG